MKEIEIVFDKDGGVKMEGKGFKGAECDKYISQLETALGVTKRKIKKPEHRLEDRQKASN